MKDSAYRMFIIREETGLPLRFLLVVKMLCWIVKHARHGEWLACRPREAVLCRARYAALHVKG